MWRKGCEVRGSVLKIQIHGVESSRVVGYRCLWRGGGEKRTGKGGKRKGESSTKQAWIFFARSGR